MVGTIWVGAGMILGSLAVASVGVEALAGTDGTIGAGAVVLVGTDGTDGTIGAGEVALAGVILGAGEAPGVGAVALVTALTIGAGAVAGTIGVGEPTTGIAIDMPLTLLDVGTMVKIMSQTIR